MQGRRRDEPFNPFAPGARNKRKSLRERANPRVAGRGQSKDPKSQSPSDIGELRKKALDEMKKKVSDKSNKSATKVSETTVRKEEQTDQAKQSREDRLAELRRKSEASLKIAEEVIKSSEEEQVVDLKEVETKELGSVDEDSDLILEDEITPQETAQLEPLVEIGADNVFNQVKTIISKPKGGKRRRRRDDSRGGGRQPKTRKLDRRKYLEYKYVVREILDDEGIAEEHRSNLLGQIWAKGERMGIEESISFIDNKALENIIPETIADELRRLVKKYTTKR